ncbi:hypothetical protein [Antarcticirhabdus aurantiaca]|uniref:Uncharacterized protein n=1 Tax=Antarcticirhabdus aurantiaca TaxID=2606717 RepID=A0ACD4NVH6_9HYPH|nr:hypothetical protein OXU80_12390 [Jeongeuplla avenae]
MDLQNIKPATQKVDIRHPGTGAATGLVFEVVSKQSDSVKAVERRQLDKQLRSRAKKATAADFESDMMDRTAAAVVGWEWKGDAAWGGKKLEFTKENVAAVLATSWVRNQVEEVINDDASFFES